MLEWMTGDIILKEETDIYENETAGELWNRLSTTGANLLVRTLENIENGKIIRTKQPDNFTIAPKLEKEISKIDWNNKTAIQIKNLVRGLNPGLGTYSILENKKIKFWKVEAIAEEDYEFSKIDNNIQNGFIKTVDGIISVLEIQGENAKKMNIKDFLRGNKIENGCKFE